MAKTVPIRWRAGSSGGVGSVSFAFLLSDGTKETEVQRGPSPEWEWRPSEAGRYRVKAVVTDALGNRAESGWSAEYEVAPTIGKDARIAVFPLENMAGTAAPDREIMVELKRRLAERDIRVLEDRSLEKFMARHRVRYAGGLTRELGRAFQGELGVDAVLIPSLDLYDDSFPPKIGFTARLVSTEEKTAILWADGVSLSGDQRPGLLGLGLVRDPTALVSSALGRIVDSIDGYMSGKPGTSNIADGRGDGESAVSRDSYLPRESFWMESQPVIRGEMPVKVAILSFINRSARPYAGDILSLKFLAGFSRKRNVEVVEPGVVRQALLQSRLIMEGGLSLPQADLLRELLEVDYVVSGEVMNYQDSKGTAGAPYVEFGVYVIDAKRRQAVWRSSSYGRGDDRVILFDWGKTHTAGALVAEMIEAVTDLFLEGGRTTVPAGDPAVAAGSGLP